MTQRKATLAAILPDADSFDEAALALGAEGVPRQQMRIVCADRGTQAGLVELLGVSPLCEAGSGNAEQALYDLQFRRSRARYFANALASRRVLLVLSGTDLRPHARCLSRFGADFGPLEADGAETREVRVPLRSEKLDIQKFLVDVGSVNVHREVTTETVKFEVTLMREDLVIECVAPGSETPEVTRIPIAHEDVRVTKRTTLDNEIRITRHRYDEVQRIEKTMRHEEARVQSTGEVTLQSD